MENKMTKAIIFDLDNTLIDRQRAFREMLERRFAKYIDDKKLIDKMTDDIIFWDNNGMNKRIDVFNKWIDKYNITFITAEQLDNDWSKESGSICYLYDDVRSTLAELRKRYKLAVLSNGNKESQRRKLSTIDIYDLLDYSLISGEFGTSKPDVQRFLNMSVNSLTLSRPNAYMLAIITMLMFLDQKTQVLNQYMFKEHQKNIVMLKR